MAKLKRSFYVRDDVVGIARDLLGKVLVTRFEGKTTSGIISETEAYAGVIDRASHAFGQSMVTAIKLRHPPVPLFFSGCGKGGARRESGAASYRGCARARP